MANKSTAERVPTVGRLCKYGEYMSIKGKSMANIKVFSETLTNVKVN